MIKELLNLKTIERKCLNGDFYCFYWLLPINNTKILIAGTINIKTEKLQCLYLPCWDKTQMVDKLKAHNKKYQYLKIYAEDKPPIYRKAKRLIGIAPIDCKLWVTEETTLAQITNLLADMKFCQQLPPVDEGKEWENFLRYNDYPDYI